MNLEEEVKNIFFEVFPAMTEEEFDWNKNQKDYEKWDSFAHLHLITLTEEKFKISLSVDESTDIDSAKKILECVKSRK